MKDQIQTATPLNYREYRNIDKSTWARGEWDDEPDKVQWIDPETNLDCLIVRNGSGSLCGYVGVPEGHRFHGMEYDEIYKQEDIDVHGGLTFTNFCSKSKEEGQYVCHVPAPGRSDKVFWLGFDCAHSGDVTPKYRESVWHADTYKTISYVKKEIGRLARQLAAVPVLNGDKIGDMGEMGDMGNFKT